MAPHCQSLRNLSARLRARSQELRRAAEAAFRHERSLKRHADEVREKTLPAMERGTTARVDCDQDARMPKRHRDPNSLAKLIGEPDKAA
jgi:hypothetical protein